jgi:hypothetical protein
MLEWFKDKDVALIGSAGALFEQEYGKQIDEHEVVVRINRGVIIKSQKSQGSKTDYWAIGKPKTVSDIISNYKFKGNIHLAETDRNPKHPNIDFYIPISILNKLKSPNEYNHRKPSSGLMILYYIFQCKPKSLSLYGFDWNKSGTWYHIPWNHSHDWQCEEKYIKNRILNQTNVSYYKPKKTNKKLKFKDSILQENWFTPEQQKMVDENRSKYIEENSDDISYGN